MKKILYIITQSELGGAQRYLFDLVDNLHEEFDISVALGPLPRSHSEASEQGSKGELAKQLNKMGIKYYTIPHLKRAISPIDDFLAIFEIKKLIKNLKPDIVHLNSSKVSILGSIAGLLTKTKIVYTVHGWVFNEPLSSLKKIFYKYAEKFTATFKNKIICISKLDYEIAKTQLKISEKKLTLIHHGIKPINFLSREQAREKIFPVMLEGVKRPITSRDEQQTRDSIAHSSKMTNGVIIGTIGNLYRTKGFEYLIEATRLLTDLGFNVKTVVIGEGDERKNLENMIGQNNLRSKFFLAGKMDNAAELLPAFDIFVSSSVKEGFPYNILEAMQAGLPIVATNVGGIPEMIIDGENGLLAEPQNPEELAQKIRILIEDGELKNTFKERARKDVIEKFTIEKMIEETKKIYIE